MKNYQISDLLDEIKSNEPFTRNAAIKKIIKEKINDEKIIAALSVVIENDPSMSVRNFARTALDVFGVEHSAVEVPIVLRGGQEQRQGYGQDQNNITDTVNDWSRTGIGFLVGVIPGLIWYFLTRNTETGILFIVCVGPGGLVGGLLGASIAKRDNIAVWIAAILGSILGAGILLVIAFIFLMGY